MKIGLGTVQFGLDYGITNPNGMISREEGASILGAAGAGGIRVIDTAAAYGESESVLGELVPACGYPFDIVTKTIPLKSGTVGDHEVRVFREGIARSLLRLKTDSVQTLMVHHAEDLLVPGGERLYEELVRVRDAGKVKTIGFSAYDARQVELILEKYEFSVAQLPISIFDQRLIDNGTLRDLHSQGIEVHARSVFLQGLLLQDTGVPEKFSKWSGLMDRYHRFLAASGLTPLAAALGFVASLAEVGVVLLGVTSRRELEQCLAAYKEDMDVDFSEFSIRDLDLVDPRRWVA